MFVLGSAVSAACGFLYYYLIANKSGKIERFDVDNRFTDAARYQNLVFISGQVGGGKTIEEATYAALADVDAALQKAGTDKSKILEATIWLADIDKDYDGMNKVYDSWIVPGKPPCRACLQAKLASPEYRVEVRVIATA
jgi:enamine deaminase RidA (YjgF/YER057c/UK114 family)